jgi:integrase
VYPAEDLKLMQCPKVPVHIRLMYGLLAREGFRASELLTLTWSDVDLDNGTVSLTENKTDDPRSWALDPGVIEGLKRWRRLLSAEALRKGRVVGQRYSGRVPAGCGLSRNLRRYLKLAGVQRERLFERSDKRIPLRAHDLRATFVTVNLALGKGESWVQDRTGHTSSQMLYTYKRMARAHEEVNLGPLAPLYEAIPELAEVKL